jgi:hypothetical protein
MKSIRRILGLLWLAAGPVIIFFLLKTAIDNITAEGKADINKPIPWIIIISIFTPIAAGLMIFGWYAWKGEYDEEIKS